MAESGYGLAGLGMGKGEIYQSVPAYAGLRRFYLLYHMKQQSAAFHAADAAYPANDYLNCYTCVYTW